MSRFFSEKYAALVPYTPGEQPRDGEYIKLNTNESPFPPSASVGKVLDSEWNKLRLYSDPECIDLRAELSTLYGVKPEQVIMTNGSDEALNFAFMAFADASRPLVFPDITYGFYTVFAELNNIPYTEIPLKDDFTVNIDDYMQDNRTVVIANPNAPTGIALPLCDIEKIAAANKNGVVIVDEAYVDFGGESAVSLIDKYDNLLVVQTFSKSRSMAGARLGFAIANEALIADLNTVKYSTNPYNINRLTAVAGAAALRDNDYYMENCRVIVSIREWTANELKKLGFTVTNSKTNFVFACSPQIDGGRLYEELKKKRILVRHFNKNRISDYVRITIGTKEQMQSFITAVKEILTP